MMKHKLKSELQLAQRQPRSEANLHASTPGRQILILDNQTEELKALFKHLLFRDLPVQYTTDPSLVLDQIEKNPGHIVICQALLYHANLDVSQFEHELLNLGFSGRFVVVCTDPLAARAMNSLNYRYRYFLYSLEDLTLVENLVRILYCEDPESPIEESPFVQREEVHRLKFPSELGYVDRIVRFVLDRLERAGVERSAQNAIRISLVEAISNAIEHGNENDLRKQVFLEFRINKHFFSAIVRDMGKGIDPEKRRSLQELNLEHLERGRGLYIIQKAMDEMQFNQIGNGLFMRKRISSDREGDPEKLPPENF